jgi:hypothetical protein
MARLPNFEERRARQEAEGKHATAEYRAAEEAARKQLQTLRAARLRRDAAAAQELKSAITQSHSSDDCE